VIAVVGEALVDAFVDGTVLRLHPGGGPYNTAVALARLGVPVTFLGAISTDSLGELLTTTLLDAGVSLGGRRVDAASPLAIIGIDDDGETDYQFYLHDTAFEALVEGLSQLDDDTDAVVVGSVALALDPPAAAIEEFATDASKHALIVVDPNVRPRLITERAAFLRRFEFVARVAGIVKLSRLDAEWLYPNVPICRVARHLLERGTGCVVATDGAFGATAWTTTESLHELSPRIDVVDTVGAGDAFTAGLVASLWESGQLANARLQRLTARHLSPALSWAAATGAAQCTRPFAWGPTTADVINVAQAAADEAAQPQSGG
jgi:fructokinase